MITIDLGKRIRELRQQRGISQEKFALKIGMDRTYFVAFFFTGKLTYYKTVFG